MEQTRYKKFVLQVLEKKDLVQLLQQVVKVSLEISDEWMYDDSLKGSNKMKFIRQLSKVS